MDQVVLVWVVGGKRVDVAGRGLVGPFKASAGVEGEIIRLPSWIGPEGWLSHVGGKK